MGKRFENKVVLITGGAGGIGKEAAKQFLLEGAKVALVDLNADSLIAVKNELNTLGEVIAIPADVTVEKDVQNYVEKAVSAFGTIDIFLNNAGVEGKVKPLTEQTYEDFDFVFKVNVYGNFLGMKHVFPIMKKNGGGSVIITSSVAGLAGSPNILPYVGSKHAVVGLMKTAALEGAPFNIRVNTIHPSPVNTRMMRSLEEGFDFSPDDFAKAIPLGRYGESSDIANIMLFLADDASSFITGAQYRVDGGSGA
ncbi:MAG: SDR family oxidoreductase [Kurthia sp.]|nr:SDR family oxidoreductase [Candidatus Kurthia equi]